jgi:lipopolysaccharide transport system ATP-binding protein
VSDFAVRVEGLGKQYRIGEVRGTAAHPSIRDAIVAIVRAPFENLRRLRALGSHGDSNGADVKWALRDVSFELRHGEVLGVIGPNGAGKSTLLKILSRITEPTYGRATIVGRVGSLLEVGTGFHPDLSGRMNVYFNGSLLGMDTAYIRRRFDEIVAFAGVERYIDVPVKYYSSGMAMRLAFSVAAHLEPEIIIVDEVLAVGDAEFQRRCLGKMHEVAADGRTVFFVSHNMNAISRLCSQAMLMEQGRVVTFGAVGAVVSTYLASAWSTAAPATWIDLDDRLREASSRARITAIRYCSDRSDAGLYPYTGGPLEFTLAVTSNEEAHQVAVLITLSDLHGTKLVDGDVKSASCRLVLREGRNTVRARMTQLWLNPGSYIVGVRVTTLMEEPLDAVDAAFEITVVEPVADDVGTVHGMGPVACRFSVLGVS